MEPVPNFKLNSGYEIPLIGFGTARNVELVDMCIEHALAAGYRLFDTARKFRNEQEVGDALKRYLPLYNIKREDVFISTKIPLSDENAAEHAETCLKESLERLQVDYIDLVMIHYPKDWKEGVNNDRETNRSTRYQTWRKLEEFQECGLIRSIGVSNYEVYHLQELLGYAKVKPSVNQIEFHPYCSRAQILAMCKDNNIFVQGYSCLMRGNREIHTEPVLKKLREKFNVNTETILYAFPFNAGVGIIPNASTPIRINENIFQTMKIKLSREEVRELMDLDRNHNLATKCWPYKVL